MKRQDFLFKIQEFFSDISAGLIAGYKSVLDDPDGVRIDYDELYRVFLAEYKYRTAPMPAWFAEKVGQVKIRCGPEPLINQHLREGKAKILSYDSDKKEYTIQTPLGVYNFSEE